jgi:hypothetical protein
MAHFLSLAAVAVGMMIAVVSHRARGAAHSHR